MRRLIPLVVLIAATLRADEPMPASREMLHDYLRAEAQKHFDARRKVVAALKTPDDVRRRQDELRRAFLAALGDQPDRTPLKPQVIGRKQCDGYTLERVVYESRPDHHVTANLYLPAGKGPFPGVLMPCGHSANGKASDAYQRAAILLATNGLAVLCYDPIGQGERIQLLDRMGKPAIKGSTSEHTLAGVGAILVGRNTASYRIWDGIRSLDYLASRPEIDPKRLGCTGNSGGGTLTAYLMALDDRILAAAPSCYITSLERLFATIGPQDAEQNITGQVAFGMEHVDYVTMRAPKPTLILTGTQDFFDIQGSWTTFREAKLHYGLLGHGERVDLFEYNDKHGFSKPRREAALRWMRRWLLNKDDALVEGAFPIHKDADLQCTRTGQVLEDYKGRSVFDLNAEREAELARLRRTFLDREGTPGLSREMKRLIALHAIKSAVASYTDEGKSVREIRSFQTEPGIVVPARYVPHPDGNPRALTIYLSDAGIDLAAKADGPISRLMKERHHDVLVIDVRGTGTTAPGSAPWDKPGQLGRDVREAFLGLHINRPLLGQRCCDLLAVVEKLGRKVHVVASGSLGPVALHAAALDERIESVTLEGSLVSWSSVVRTPISKAQLGNVVPGVLAFYDLPDLAAALAPRPLTIRSAVDAAGNGVPQEELQRVYAGARQAYKARKQEGNLVLSAR